MLIFLVLKFALKIPMTTAVPVHVNKHTLVPCRTASPHGPPPHAKLGKAAIAKVYMWDFNQGSTGKTLLPVNSTK